MATRARGFSGAIVDRAVGKIYGLPPETCNYTTTCVRIPIPASPTLEAIELAADVFRPALANDNPDEKARGTIVCFGPYGRGPDMALRVRPFASRGYNLLLVTCRGTYGSGGVFDPYRTEVHDGRAVVEWMRQQEWYTGSFAMVEASYMTFTQWAMLSDPPEDMVAAAMSTGPHDFARAFLGTGALNNDIVYWSEVMVHQEDKSIIPGWDVINKLWTAVTAKRRLHPVLDGLPLADSIDRHFAGHAPWIRSFIVNPDIDDPHRAPMRHGAAVEKASIPVLLIAGWNDIFLDQMVEEYDRLHERGCIVGLIVGPWTHLTTSGTARETLAWFKEHMAPNPNAKNSKAPEEQSWARVFVTGVNEWRRLPKWPPPTTPFELFLESGKRLSDTKPPLSVASGNGKGRDDASNSSFTFDPEHATPSNGGPMFTHGGVVDDSCLAKRADVLAFSTEKLDSDLEVLGKPVVELAHSSDTPYADLFVRISEVDIHGRSRNVTEAYMRLDPQKGSGPVRIELRDCAHVFKAGNRLRLYIAGGWYPAYGRNPGIPGNPGLVTELRSARHTIHHGRDGVSRLLLPVASTVM